MSVLRLAVLVVVASGAVAGLAELAQAFPPAALLALAGGVTLGRSYRRAGPWPRMTPLIFLSSVLLLTLLTVSILAGTDLLSTTVAAMFNVAQTIWTWPDEWTRRFQKLLKRLHARLPTFNRAIPLSIHLTAPRRSP